MSNGAFRFSTFFGQKSLHFFHQNEPETTSKIPKNTKYFANSVQKNQNRPAGGLGGFLSRAILMFFGPNLQNILCFWGFLMGIGVVLMKKWRDFVKKSRKS
jgi:hypothetical protein